MFLVVYPKVLFRLLNQLRRTSGLSVALSVFIWFAFIVYTIQAWMFNTPWLTNCHVMLDKCHAKGYISHD